MADRWVIAYNIDNVTIRTAIVTKMTISNRVRVSE